MSIYRIKGIKGEIVTTNLPSGDLAVSSPQTGPLEQLVFNICRWDGRRAPTYGGWLIPMDKSVEIQNKLAEKCIVVAK